MIIYNNNNNKIEFQFRQQLVDGVLTTFNMQYTSSWPLQRGSFHIFFALDGAFPFMTGCFGKHGGFTAAYKQVPLIVFILPLTTTHQLKG